jgi:thymidylate kinase
MHSDELTPLERQLAACRPSAAGLDSDAMLFAAGRAAAQPRRQVVWPALTCGFAVLSAMLAAGLMSERSERLTLAARLRPTTVAMEQPTPTVVTSLDVPPDSYLAACRMIERGVDLWPAPVSGPSGGPMTAPPSAVLRAWDTVLEQ